MIIEITIGLVVGFIAGLLVARNNIEKLNDIILGLEKVLESNQAEIDNLNKKKRRKLTTKKTAPKKRPQVD